MRYSTSLVKLMILYITFIKLFFPKNKCLDITATEVLNKLNIPTVSVKEVQLCKGTITKYKMFETSKLMKNNKSPGNGGFSMEFYKLYELV